MGNVKQNTTTGAVMNENQDSTNDPMRAIGHPPFRWQQTVKKQ